MCSCNVTEHPRAAPTASDITKSFAVVGVICLVWVILQLRSPDLTYHFAPLLAALGGPLLLRRNGRRPLKHAAVVGVLATAVVIGVGIGLGLGDALEGPALWERGPALVEVFVLAPLGAALGVRSATSEREGFLVKTIS